MKIFCLITLLFLSSQSVEGLRCFTCNGASSNEECNLKGRIVQCQPNEGSCQNEVRLSEGKYYTITKRCKQTEACSNNQEQNDKPAWEPTQCYPQFTMNSVCRCCCSKNECNARAMPCDKAPKCPAPVQPLNGQVTCSNMNFGNSTCTYECEQGYTLVGSSEITCMENGFGLKWASETPRCERKTCGASVPRSPPNGKVTCSNSNRVGSSCTFTCDRGYEVVGSSRVVCNRDQSWSNNVPLCNRVTCDSSLTIFLTNGEVSCAEFNFYSSQCSYKCNQGFNLVGSSTSTCQADGSWTAGKPECQKITCDIAKTTSSIANGEALCSDSNDYASVCTYTCTRGFIRVGEESITCQEDGTWSGNAAECIPVNCDQTAPVVENGNVLCSNGNIFESSCLFTCNEGYLMLNPGNMVCQDNSRWTKSAPSCQQIVCTPRQNDIDNGIVECSDNNVFGSLCTYLCNPGFEMQGLPTMSCGVNGWSNPPPFCQQLTCPTTQTGPTSGRVECTMENKAFSDCKYICGDGTDRWELHGSNSTSCQYDTVTQSFEWSADPPCCARQCPPYAQVDLFLVLDSSSSVGKENWNKTVFFMKDIIDNFVISPNDMLVAAVRYNKVIDTDSEIKIGRYTDLKSTTDAIVNLPYDGSGTLTGNALYYVLQNMLTAPGNRPDVQDLVLVVTDGISKDDVATPATMLRATGTNVVALGIVNQKGSLKEEDIIDIADDPEKTVLLDTGFEGLSTELVEVILKQVCGNPCERENQYSGLAF
uniref:Uncharacterized protein n=2 Tax=Ciona savignyi TaxID=51511 RepID=H2Z8I6_CIOSA